MLPIFIDGRNSISFNVDSGFSNALDGLIVVDLLQTDPKLLERYMGKSGLELFLDYHCRQISRAR